MKAMDGRWALEKDTVVAAQALAQRGERLRVVFFCLLLWLLVLALAPVLMQLSLLLLQRLLLLKWGLRRRKRRVRLILLLTMLAVTVLTVQASCSRRLMRPVGQRCDRRERGKCCCRRRCRCRCPPHWRRIRRWWGKAHRVVRHYRHRRRSRRYTSTAALMLAWRGPRR